MGRDGRGNDSFVPRCYDCGHPVDVHNGPSKTKRGEPPCRGTLDACDCAGYRDTDPPATTDEPGLRAAAQALVDDWVGDDDAESELFCWTCGLRLDAGLSLGRGLRMGERLRRFILDPNGQVRENGDGPFVLFSDLAATTDEPGLREALELGLAVECRWRDGSDDRHCCDEHQAIRDRLEFLARTPATSDGSLDVAWLARALKPGHDFVHDGGLDDCQFADDDAAIEAATRIAAEYARLSESASEGKTE